MLINSEEGLTSLERNHRGHSRRRRRPNLLKLTGKARKASLVLANTVTPAREVP